MDDSPETIMLTADLARHLRAAITPREGGQPDWELVTRNFGKFSVFVLLEKDPLDGDQYLRGAFWDRSKAEEEALKADESVKAEQPSNASYNAYVRVVTMTISELVTRKRSLVTLL